MAEKIYSDNSDLALFQWSDQTNPTSTFLTMGDNVAAQKLIHAGERVRLRQKIALLQEVAGIHDLALTDLLQVKRTDPTRSLLAEGKSVAAQIALLRADRDRLAQKSISLEEVTGIHDLALTELSQEANTLQYFYEMEFELLRVLAILPKNSVPYGMYRIALEELRSVGRLPLVIMAEKVIEFTQPKNQFGPGEYVPFENGFAAITSQYTESGVNVDLNLFRQIFPGQNVSSLSQIGVRIVGGLPEVRIGIGEAEVNGDLIQPTFVITKSSEFSTTRFSVPKGDTRENVELGMGDVADDASNALRHLSTAGQKWLFPKSRTEPK